MVVVVVRQALALDELEESRGDRGGGVVGGGNVAEEGVVVGDERRGEGVLNGRVMVHLWLFGGGGGLGGCFGCHW